MKADTLYSFYTIMERALESSFLSVELKAWDEARAQLKCVMEMQGMNPIDDDDLINFSLTEEGKRYKFDSRGNILDVTEHLEYLLGQDHDWWIYSNDFDAYLCTYAKSEENAKEYMMNEPWIPEDNWNNEDIDY